MGAISQTLPADRTQDGQRVIEKAVDTMGALHEICAFAERGTAIQKEPQSSLPLRGFNARPASHLPGFNVQVERRQPALNSDPRQCSVAISWEMTIPSPLVQQKKGPAKNNRVQRPCKPFCPKTKKPPPCSLTPKALHTSP